MLKIGLAQFSVQPGNAEANTEKMKQYIERAKKNKCHLIIFRSWQFPDISSVTTGISLIT